MRLTGKFVIGTLAGAIIALALSERTRAHVQAALADVSEELISMLQNVQERIDDAVQSGKRAAAQREMELHEIFKDKDGEL